MALYRYIKKSHKSQVTSQKSILKFFSVFLIIIGLGLLASVAYPLFSYQIFATSYFQPEFLTPLADSVFLSPVVLEEERDLTQIANWFPNGSIQMKSSSKITYYTISIPHLKILSAAVKIGGENLKESLIHYSGAALPGEFGNTVIFGHSVLPQFFNPKNYLTIFSTLPTLEKGDWVLVEFDGIEYQYKVYEMVEVKPDDVSILEQRYDGSYLTLVTCVPPGTYWKRLAVRARLEKI